MLRNYLKLMNKFMCFMMLCLYMISCNKQVETIYETSAKIYLINNSSVLIKSDDVLGYSIQPNDTVIHVESNKLDGDKPHINNYFLSFEKNNNFFRYNNDESKCEKGIYTVKNYENRKETSDLSFEFTFRFTDEKMAKAESCE